MEPDDMARVRALLAKLVAQAAAELRREGESCIAAAQRCEEWL